MVMKQQEIILPWSILFQEDVMNDSNNTNLFIGDW